LTETIHDEIDAKSKLHEWCQKHKRVLLFEVQSHKQDQGSSQYKIVAKVDQVVMGIGEGNSKKAAEQMAARRACDHLII
jgi:ribonuclease-3